MFDSIRNYIRSLRKGSSKTKGQPGRVIAQEPGSVAIGGDGGEGRNGQGGRGGDAVVFGKNSIAIGGRGGDASD